VHPLSCKSLSPLKVISVRIKCQKLALSVKGFVPLLIPLLCCVIIYISQTFRLVVVRQNSLKYQIDSYNTTGATNGAGTAYPCESPGFASGFCGFRVAQSLVFCVVFVDYCFFFLFRTKSWCRSYIFQIDNSN
jgi:hypothetical protein